MKYFEQIEAWLNNELDGDDRAAFEKQMADDPELADEVALFQDLAKGAEYAGIRDAVKRAETELEQEHFFTPPPPEPQPKPPAKPRNNRWLWIAAIVLSVVAVWMFWPPDPEGMPKIEDAEKPAETTPPAIGPDVPVAGTETEKPTPGPQDQPPAKPSPPAAGPGSWNDAYAAFYQPEQAVLTDILDRLEATGFGKPDRERDLALAKALTLFDEKKFGEARPALEGFLKQYPSLPLANLYLGITCMELGDFEPAVKYLAPPSRDTNFEYANTAQWYLALAFARQGDTAASNKLMKELATGGDAVFAEQAKRFLKFVEKN